MKAIPRSIHVGVLSLLLFLSACDVMVTDEFFKSVDKWQPKPLDDPGALVEWLSLLNETVKSERISPPKAARIHGYVATAFYEGLVHGYPGYRSVAGQINGLPSLPLPYPKTTYDWPTVAIAAESATLLGLLPATTAADTRFAIEELREAQIDGRRSTRIFEEIVVRSREYGERLAEALLARAAVDGSDDASQGGPYDRPVGPGYWVPTPPAMIQNPLLPWWGDVMTFTLEAIEECQPNLPPAYSEDPSSEFWRQMQEVYDIGTNPTQEQLEIALYWADDPGLTSTPPGHWLGITRSVILEKDLTLMEGAEAFLFVGFGLSDAFISGWKVKYETNYIRPVTAIQRLIDANWLPQVNTPPFPEYTSGHSVGSGAAGEALTVLVGDNVSFTDDTHVSRGIPAKTFASFNEAADEAAVSRLYGGIHFAEAINVGVEQGRCVARRAMARVKTRVEV